MECDSELKKGYDCFEKIKVLGVIKHTLDGIRIRRNIEE